MREIKFRGKRVDDGDWLYGSYISQNLVEGERSIRYWGGCNNCDLFEEPIDPATVGQFTGLKDKNGKEIYEGDVVAQPDDYGTFCHQLVVYAEGRFIPLVRAEYGHNAIDRYDPSAFEVIGNIHDNPELVKGGWPK